ncbi:MAG: hypothetical protein QOD06_2454, partial [Candidatus Binatota bacterium]|nr:hypothetical protein [Candidatus Binatota bacterium]
MQEHVDQVPEDAERDGAAEAVLENHPLKPLAGRDISDGRD